MIKYCLGILLCLAAIPSPGQQPTPTGPLQAIPAVGLSTTWSAANRVLKQRVRPSLDCEPNRGQVASRSEFVCRNHDLPVFLASNRAIVELRRRAAAVAGASTSEPGVRAVGLTFVGADPEAISVATESLPGRSHYLLGNDPAKWITDLPHYAGIQYSEIFPNIDLVYYGKDGHLEFDLVVHPGARLEGVILKFDGAASLALDAQGDLIIAVGDLQLVLHRPMAYQIKGTEKEPVQARFVLLSPGEVGFSLGAHDPGRTVVIDPVLSYSTYVGGSSFDFATAIAVDSSGNIFVAGKTDSSDFPGTALSNTPSLSRAFVRKYDPAGNLVFSSYFGGIDLGAVTDLEVTAAGSPIITGFTATGNFPVVNALQPTFRGPYDAFITKLEPSGSAFVFSTFLGGDSLEQAWGLALDSSENIYVVGDTRSENFPVTAGVFQSANAGGQDTFVSKINASGSALVYSTYFGASGGEFAGDIAVDASGNAYITGDTNSLDFPTKNAFQPTCRSCVTPAAAARAITAARSSW